jgi:DNA-directed RNA polymerase
MADLGFSREDNRSARAVDNRQVSRTPAGRNMLRAAVSRVADGLSEWKSSNRRGQTHAYEPLSELPSDVAALVACQFVLDSVGHERPYPTTILRLGGRVEDEIRYRRFRKEARSEFWKAVKRNKAKQGSYDELRKHLVRLMREVGVVWQPWSHKKKAQVGLVLLELIVDRAGLVEVCERVSVTGPLRAQRIVLATQATLAWLEQAGKAVAAVTPQYLPSVDRPADWVNLNDGGYLTNLLHRRPLVRTRSGRQRVMTPDQVHNVLGAVNVLQRTPWEVNPFVAKTMRHYVDLGLAVADLPPREDPPLPPKPDSEDEGALRDWRRQYAISKRRQVELRGKRVQSIQRTASASRYSGKVFYYPHQLDFRGRAYPLPTSMQPQGPSADKGLIRFAVGARMDTPEAERWLAIHGSNAWGNDKVPFEDRVAWVWQRDADVRLVAEDPLEHSWWQDADDPWVFLAWCDEWARYRREGARMVGRLPVTIDGRNNGLQVFSLLLRDEVGGAATNCLPSDVPRDVYQDVADLVTDSLRLSDDPLAARWLAFFPNGRVTRDVTKRPVMTLPYGATIYAARRYVLDWAEEETKKRGANPFQEETGGRRDELPRACSFLATLIWEAIGRTVTSATECMRWLRAVSRAFSEEGMHAQWTTPSGFKVRQVYNKWHVQRITTSIGERVRAAKILSEDGAGIEARRAENAISPNFVHSLDAAAMVGTLLTAADRGVEQLTAVHDSFGAPAAQADVLFRAVRDAYAMMFSEDLLARFRDEAQAQLHKHTLPEMPKYGTLEVFDLLDSAYFFS